jgi:hypothetical protein
MIVITNHLDLAFVPDSARAKVIIRKKAKKTAHAIKTQNQIVLRTGVHMSISLTPILRLLPPLSGSLLSYDRINRRVTITSC